MSNYDSYPAPGPQQPGSQAPGAPRRLTRRRHDKMIAGVCGGIADHFGVDANIVRLVLVAAVVFGAGCGILLYLAGWWLLPQE